MARTVDATKIVFILNDYFYTLLVSLQRSYDTKVTALDC